MLAVFSTACSSSSSDSSSSSSGDSSPSSDTPKDQKTDPPSKKPPVTVSSCTITQFQDETGKTQAIVAGKGQDLEREQTLKFFYDCNIAKKDYNQKATLAVSGNTAITTSVTEIAIPAQAKIADSFTVTGLKTADTNVQTSIKIELEKSDVLTQLALTVTPTFVLDKAKVKIAEITSTGLTLSAGGWPKKLEVYQNQLYLLEATGRDSTAAAKFYSSSDGKIWQPAVTPQDKADNTQKLSGWDFDTAVHDGKLWVLGSDDSLNYSAWNFDGTSWTRVGQGRSMSRQGSALSFQGSLYHVGGLGGIYAFDVSQWITNGVTKYHFPDRLDYNRGQYGTVVFQNKIWLFGGKKIKTDGSGNKIIIPEVATFDGTTYQKVADLSTPTWSSAMEVFPRGLLVISGSDDLKFTYVDTVFWSRFGKKWTKITTGITDQSKLSGVISGATVVWNDALWAVNITTNKILKITYEE